MSRIKLKELEERANYLSELFNREFAIIRYNGYYHLEIKTSHENICTGTAREVMDAMYFMRIAYNMTQLDEGVR